MLSLLKSTGIVFNLPTSILSASSFNLGKFDFNSRSEVSITVNQRSLNKFFDFFWNMFYKKTIKMFMKTKQSNEPQYQNTHQDSLHMPHSLFYQVDYFL